MEMEKKKRLKGSGLRGLARFCALQNVYEREFNLSSGRDNVGSDTNTTFVEAFLSDAVSISDMDKEFLCRLLTQCNKNVVETDKIINGSLSKNWSMSRLDPVTKCILRLGVTELRFFEEIPSNVIFNEYIELAKSFFDTPEVSFINGLLNKVAEEVRAKTEEKTKEKRVDPAKSQE